MDEALLGDIAEWIERAERCTLKFWRPAKRDFWRDTAEISKATPEAYYPTATFMAVATLRDPLQPPIKGDGLTFAYSPFLEGIETTFDEYLESSDVAAGATGKRTWNVYTSAWSVRALVAAHTSVLHCGSPGLSESDRKKWLAWAEGKVEEQGRKIHDHLEALKGASLPEEQPHPFLTCHATAALRTATRIAPPLAVTDDVKHVIRTQAEAQIKDVLINHLTGSVPPGDLVALPYYAALLEECGSSGHTALISSALDLVCSSPVVSGGWPLLGTVLPSPGGHGVHISAFDVGATLLKLCHRLRNQIEPNDSQLATRQRAFGALFEYARRSFGSKGTDDHVYQGWSSSSYANGWQAECWTTALALRFLKKLRSYVQAQVQRTVLSNYDTIWPYEMKNWISLDEVDEPYPGKPVTKYIEKHFIASLGQGASRLLPSKPAKNVSMILFGPPGTSKTTIVKALAKRLEWPLLTVTPALFLAKGSELIDAEAGRVFADLAKLERVVVLFDECDELFHQRSPNPTADRISLVSLITGAMLPRLQNLHDRGRLIFVLATNRLGAIDKAVRRDGRIDHIIAIGPPDAEARVALLAKNYPDLPDGHRGQVAQAIDGLTRDEVLRVAQFVLGLWQRDHAIKGETLAKRAKTFLTAEELTIGPDYASFDKDREKYSRAEKEA